MAEHETKFSFPNGNAHSLIRWLMGRCREDGTYPRGIISSIYYDTADWNFLGEKFNSDYLKTKFRLRWYQQVGSLDFSSQAFFEKKEKIGSSRQKRRIVVPMAEAIRTARYLNEPYFFELPLQEEIRELGIGRPLVPVFQISYIRHRFIDVLSGARLAVDSMIHVPRINPQAVKKHRTLPMPTAVFEYKAESADLPDWLHGVTLFGCRRGAFSKYSTCYRHIAGLPD